MLLIEVRRPSDVRWHTNDVHRLLIMDTETGWYRPLFFKDQDAVIGVINAAIDAATLLGHKVDHVVIKEG